MSEMFQAAIFERDTLADALTKISRQSLKPFTWEALAREQIPARGGAVGRWGAMPGDPLPEVLIVRDQDFADTLAWLNSFFSALSPITQWCRVLPHSRAESIAMRSNEISLGHMLGAWVGAILAECSVQSGGTQSLRDVLGSAAISTSTFAAGRAAAVWHGDTDFKEIARRHDELSNSLREGSRPIAAHSLIPMWGALNGRLEQLSTADRRALEPVCEILARLSRRNADTEQAELVSMAASDARDYFDLPELTDCAAGPQVERVRALDRLADRLASGPRSASIDALLGLGASFIDPGSAVSPELLRKHTRHLPIAPLWQGVFAGAIAPVRVMVDQGGLGRVIAKSLSATGDLEGRPSCDIAYEELIRWITPGRPLKSDLRAMSARALSVEIIPGVTCLFAYGRTESPAVPAPRSQADLKGSAHNLHDLDLMVQSLRQRVERLERLSGGQQSLDLPEPKDPKARKSSKPYSGKRT